MATIFCENINRKIQVSEKGVNLRSALLAEGVRVYSWPRNYRLLNLLNCGGNGRCGTCAVEVLSGNEKLSPLTGKERAQLKLASQKRRLSCQCQVYGDVTIRVRP